MAITFPLSSATFWSTLKLDSCLFTPTFGQESSGTGRGAIIVKDMRPQLWAASCQTVDLSIDEYADLSAWIEILREGLSSFMAYDPFKAFPKADPGGLILGASTVSINDVTGPFGLSLTGLPVGYVLTRGDLIGFNDGSVQRLHRVAETTAAISGGVTPTFEVRPKISQATEPALAVSLVRPEVKMSIVPRSFRPSDGRSSITRVASFEIVQRID